MMKKYCFLVVMLFLCLVVVSPVLSAQETSHVRFAHFVFDAPQVNIYVDEVVFAGEDGSAYPLNPLELSRQYLELSADTPHTFAVVPADKTLDSALFEPAEFTFVAGSNYTLAIMGNVAADDLHFVLMDETAALAEFDPTVSAVTFVFNNLYGLPAVDLYWADEIVLDNLAYGDYVAAQDATEGMGSRFTAHGDVDTVLFELPDAIAGQAQTIAFFGISGHYPGTLWEDYTLPYAGNFIGEPVVRDGGSIAVGDVVSVSLSEAGLRYDYQLVLDKASVLDIWVKGGAPETGTDAILRIFDAQGNLVAQNDDFDRFNLGLDAGLVGLELDKGTYVIEAASPFDTFLGDYTLSVTTTK
ncbi:MAG: DUF4397 domain-containing protein [Chloroflexi bacterium]|nr:DUF4397 domain-containing protein [Chloroflexota bacterium]MCC6893904.1 DUF4397 domain-containing protein [Anaerolineae bacterium]